MEGTQAARTTRRLRLQAPALAIVVAAAGVAAWLLGAPAWIALLYLTLGFALGWFRLGRSHPAPARLAIGYVCVPSASNGRPRERADAIERACRDRGLALAAVLHDVDGDGSDDRPALARALEQLAAQKADVLVVPRLRDLASNVANLAPLLRWFDSERRTLIALDLALDTSTEAGRLAANAIVGLGGWEHERTRSGLEAAGARGHTAVADVPELQERVARMRADGMTLQAIADTLNAEGVPTLRGGAMWRPSSVQRAAGYRRPSAGGRGIELPRPEPPEL